MIQEYIIELKKLYDYFNKLHIIKELDNYTIVFSDTNGYQLMRIK